MPNKVRLVYEDPTSEFEDLFRGKFDALVGIKPVLCKGTIHQTPHPSKSTSITYSRDHQWSLYGYGNNLELVLPHPLKIALYQGGWSTSVQVADEFMQDDSRAQFVQVRNVAFSFEAERLTVSLDHLDDLTYETTLEVVGRLLATIDAENQNQVKAELIEMAKKYIKIPLCKHVEKMPISHLLIYLSLPVLLETKSWAAVSNAIHHTKWSETTLKMLLAMPRWGFAQLFREYCGTKSPTIMNLIASKFVTGNDYCRLKFDDSCPPNQINYVRQTHADRIIEDEPKTLITVGNKRVRPELIWYAGMLLKLLPLDTARAILEGLNDAKLHQLSDTCSSFYGYDRGKNDTESLMRFFGRLSPQTRKSMLAEPERYREYLDVEKQIDEFSSVDKIPPAIRHLYPDGLVPPKNWKTFKEYHDKVSKQYNEIKAEANNKKIQGVYEKLTHHAKLHGMQVGDLTLRLPQETKELVEWGRDLSICIASYADRAAEGRTVLVGFFRDGKITYAMELPPEVEAIGEVESRDGVFGIRFKKGIRQFVKQNNRPVEDPDLTSILTVLGSWATEGGAPGSILPQSTSTSTPPDEYPNL